MPYFGKPVDRVIKQGQNTVGSDAIIDDSVIPAKLDSTASYTVGGLTVDGAAIADDFKAISNTPTVQLLSPNSTNGYRLFANVSDTVDGGFRIDDVSESNAIRFNIANNGDISFYDSTGSNAKFFWDASAEQLGIGTTATGADLHISSIAPEIRLTDTNDSNVDHFINGSGSALVLSADENNELASSTLRFKVDGTEAMRIDSSGNVGIGTSSPSCRLHIKGSESSANIILESSTNANAQQIFKNTGTASGFYVGLSGNTSGDAVLYHGDAKNMLFSTDATERMRIDSSGNFLFGCTSNSPTTQQGITMGTNYKFHAVRSSGSSGYFNRLTNDGVIVEFAKDGTTVGNIGSNGTASFIACPAGSGAGLRFDGGDNRIVPTEGDGTNRNGAVDLGYPSSRFKDLYLSGGVYVGGTGSANHLDDYEEGTWTPSLRGGSASGSFNYTYRNGWYTKVGQLVTIHFNVAATVATAPSGQMEVFGVPFTSVDESVGSFMCNDMGDSYQTNVAHYTPIIQNGHTYVHFRGTKTDGSGFSSMQAQSVSYMRVTITYKTS